MPKHRWPKPIIIAAQPGPNYLWHVLAVARIGYDSDYADGYRDTVLPADREYLQANGKLLEFGYGEGGALSGFFTALPAWLGLETKADFATYFTTLDAAIQRENLMPFVEAYTTADWSDRFFGELLKQPDFPVEIKNLRDTAACLGEIYLRNLDAYYRDVWPQAESAMRQRVADLNDFCGGRDIIAEWEQLLGMDFVADQYLICLCYANKNGPDYNSLGYSKNLFYYDKPRQQTLQFLSHEVGTHLLIDLYFELARTGGYEHHKLYAAYESLAMFYNRLIMGVQELDYTLPKMNDRWHLGLYARAYVDGIEPTALLHKALQPLSEP